MKSDFALPSREEIAAMLTFIPPKPDYATWLRIASAVWSVLPLVEGCQVLAAWSPEQHQGEYLSKHRYRLKRVGIGSLIHLAMQHGYQPKRKHAGVFLFAETPRRTARTKTLIEMLQTSMKNPQTPPTCEVVHVNQGFDLYIGRANARRRLAGSKWANPFKLPPNATEAERAEVIERYRRWILTQPDLLAALPELAGKRLGCWCKPKACHGDVLKELLENYTTDKKDTAL